MRQTLACFVLLLNAAPQFQLPDTAQPLRYALDLTIIPSEPAFRGVATIDVNLKRGTAFLWLNGKGLRVDKAVLRIGGASLNARVRSAGGEFLGFALPHVVGPGQAQLEIRYQGTLSAKLAVG